MQQKGLGRRASDSTHITWYKPGFDRSTKQQLLTAAQRWAELTTEAERFR